MKNLLRIFLCITLLSGLWGCEDDTDASAITINSGAIFLSLDGLARSGKLTVCATGAWQVTPKVGSDWVTLSALEGNAGDPTATFGLYVDDLRCRIGYDWFVEQGIDSARVRVSMLSDGTATYNNFYEYFGNAATVEQNWNKYAAEVEALDWDHGGHYPETRVTEELESWMWPYYLATRPGYRLVLQDRNLLESSGDFMTAQLAAMELESVQPYQMLAALPLNKQQQFYHMADFDYNHFAKLFDASPKKNLIVIGTSHRNESSEQTQRRYVARIVEQYAAQYDIFFKPHPADKSSADYEERFGLTLLPGQMPFEIFVWSLLDKIEVIGGYPSTVFLSVPIDKVRFLFAPNAASLVHPLNLLFRDAMDIEWCPVLKNRYRFPQR